MLIGQTIRVEFVTPSLATGAATDADALPTALIRKNGSTVGAATVSVSNLGTGLYLAETLINAAHGWVVGDSYSVEATWTMAGTAGIKATLAQGLIETDIDAVLTAIKGGSWSTETLKAIYDLIGTRLADADYTAPDNATITAIAGYVDTEIAAIKAKTDQLAFTDGEVHATVLDEALTPEDIWTHGSRTLTSAGQVAVTVLGPVATSGDITIVRGDSYQLPERALEWQTSDEATWPDLTGASITFTARYKSSELTTTGAVIVATGATKQVRVELTALETDALAVAHYTFDVEAVLDNGHIITLVQNGRMTVLADQTRPAN